MSRIKAERKANPGYRAFFSNGHNVTRAVALFIGEIVIEVWAAARQRRRDVQPRGHQRRYVSVPACGDVRLPPRPHRLLGDLGHAPRPSGGLRDALRATTRWRTTPVLSGTTRSRRSASSTSSSAESREPADMPRARTRSSSSPITGRRRARRSGSATGTGWTISSATRSRRGRCRRCSAGDENDTAVGLAFEEARDAGAAPTATSGAKQKLEERAVVVLGSGNLGLIYLMEARRRLSSGGDRGCGTHASCTSSPRASATSASSSLAPRSVGRSRSVLVVRGISRRTACKARTRSAPSRRMPPTISSRLGRLRARRRPLRQQLLRPTARRGLRLRGADLVPRWHGWLADAALHPRPGRAPAAERQRSSARLRSTRSCAAGERS